MAKAPATVRLAWQLREDLEPDPTPAKLAYWLERAGDDPWTFDDLIRLTAAVLDADEDAPAPLSRWALEVATSRRTRPVQRGPARDPTRDFAIALMVDVLLKAGLTQRQAFARLGTVMGRSQHTIESARRRALSV